MRARHPIRAIDPVDVWWRVLHQPLLSLYRHACKPSKIKFGFLNGLYYVLSTFVIFFPFSLSLVNNGSPGCRWRNSSRKRSLYLTSSLKFSLPVSFSYIFSHVPARLIFSPPASSAGFFSSPFRISRLASIIASNGCNVDRFLQVAFFHQYPSPFPIFQLL